MPYLRQPEELVLGEALWFATAMELGGRVNGLLVKSHEGRPTKIEGNPDHPKTQGRSSVQMQAALLNLYDPGRSKGVVHQGQPGTWNDFLGALVPHRASWHESGGKGLRLLTNSIASPALMEQIEALLKKHPAAKWHKHDAAFPSLPVETHYHFERAEVILSLGADFLGSPNASLRDIGEFTRKRSEASGMSRLYVVETMPSLTGAMADHRLALSPTAMEVFAAALTQGGRTDAWMAAVSRELQQHQGRSLVVAGDFESAAVHSAARLLNDSLGNTGHTVEYRSSEGLRPSTLEDLVADMQRGGGERDDFVGCGPSLIRACGCPLGLPPGEGAFLPCSFWLADCLHLTGRSDEARELFQRLLGLRNDLGLLAEEYDSVQGRMLGNFPQAFSHVGLVNTAGNLSRQEGPARRRSAECAHSKT